MGLGVSLALFYVGSGNLGFSIWGAISSIFLELTIITAVAIVFSSFSSPALSALLTFLVFVIGHFSSSLRDFAANFGSTAEMFFEAIYYILPNFSHFEFITNSAHGSFPPTAMLGGSFVYTIVYNAILLSITTSFSVVEI